MKLHRLLRRKYWDRERALEVESHVEHEIDDNLARGMEPEEARRQAHIKLGNPTRIREEIRRMNSLLLLESLWWDVRYALRQMGKSPGFAATVVLTLALGIGGVTAVFSVVYAVLLRPLPYKNANRMVMVWQHPPGNPSLPIFDSYREFEAWKHASHSFEEMAVATWAEDADAILSWHGLKRNVVAIPVSDNFFSMLGEHAALGRTFEKRDLKSPCAVVLSHGFWQRRLGSAPNWIGKSLVLNGMACTVLGVMPKSFNFYPRQSEMWTLITPESKFARDPWNMPVEVFGTLKRGVRRVAAIAELTGIEGRILPQDTQDAASRFEPNAAMLQSEFTWLTGRNLRNALIVLLVAAFLVLLIACVNVANLLLGRAMVRQKELGVRIAIGARRSRVIRQLLTESALLSLVGASLGVLLAIGSVHYIGMKEATQLPPGNPVSINWAVLAFTVALSILTCFLFGLLPAWKASRTNVNEVLKQSAVTASRGTGNHRVSRTLVVTEIALSLVVLVAAGLLVESMVRLTNTSLGYARNNLLTANVSLPRSSFPKPGGRMRYWEQLKNKLESLPGVEGVAVAPRLAGARVSGAVTVEGADGSLHTGAAAGPLPVSDHYFRVLGIPQLQGRAFSDLDGRNAPRVAIVNEALARDLFPDESAVGQRIKMGPKDGRNPWLEIVGVVGNTARPGLHMGFEQKPMVYRPLRQDPNGALSVYVRTAGKNKAVEASIGPAIASVDPNLPVPAVQTMDESLSWVMAQPRFRAALFSIFAVFALLLTAVGIYGVVTQRVSQRIHELGIRVALGARHEDIWMLVIGEGLKLAVAGIAIGVVGALVLTRFLSSMLYGVQSTNAVIFVTVSVLLASVALLACFLPARRAAGVDPMRVLRME